jgi:protein TIF31
MSEKSELARQILFSFIVQSVQHNKDPVSEPTVSKKSFKFSKNSSDAIENDSAIIKIFHGNESVK